MLRYTKKASVVFCEYLFLWVVYVFVTGHVKKKKKTPWTHHCTLSRLPKMYEKEWQDTEIPFQNSILIN